MLILLYVSDFACSVSVPSSFRKVASVVLVEALDLDTGHTTRVYTE